MSRLKSKLEKSDGVVVALTWAYLMRQKTPKERKLIRDEILKRLIYFDKGVKSKDGEILFQELKSEKNWVFIGFAPYTAYIKMDAEFEDQLGCTWIHPYSMPTLVYKHRWMPMVVHVNPELSYNESVVYRLNKDMKHLKGVQGIMG